MNSRVLGASANRCSGVTIRCFLASACGSFLASAAGLGAATDVIGSPCGLVLTSVSKDSLIVPPLSPRLVLPFALHVFGAMAESGCTSQPGGRGHEIEGIGMRLPAMDFGLGPGEAHVLSVVRQFDPHLLSNPLGDPGELLQLL